MKEKTKKHNIKKKIVIILVILVIAIIPACFLYSLVELIIEKPKNEKLVSSIPEGTKVNKAELKNGIVELDLSKEFIENQTKDIEKAKLSIKAIVNTLTELNEVKAVKILIDGKENQKFKNIDLSLEKEFTREN